MSSPTGYSVVAYGAMVNCEPRMSAYAEALRRAVTPGCTVIDIGAGFGIFALLACQYGAGEVIAIETDNSVLLIPELAKVNGYGDRIRIVQDLSTNFTPDRKAEVVISDIRGILPLFEGHIATTADTRARLLAPSGTLIPSKDILKAAICSDPSTYELWENPWLVNKFDLELSGAREHAVNTYRKVYLAPDDLLSEVGDLGVLDYTTLSSPNFIGTVELVATKEGVAHGVVVWFDAELASGIGFSNAPGEPKLVYGQTMFPLEMPVALEQGDRIVAEISASLVDGSYVWAWNTAVFRKDSNNPEAFYRQSTFKGRIFSPTHLARKSSAYVPGTDPRQEIDRYCLSLVDGARSMDEIARELAAKFPERFGSAKEALDHSVALMERY